MNSDDADLIPPDFDRCQTESRDGGFMKLGPPQWVRCSKKPTHIAYENMPGSDGKKGSMSMCDDCLMVFKETFGESYATIVPIIAGD